jgi:hypothetical protein
MDLEIIIPWTMAVIAIGLYIVGLWVGDDRTMNALARISNVAMLLTVAALGMAECLGVQLTFALLLNPSNWVRAFDRLL